MTPSQEIRNRFNELLNKKRMSVLMSGSSTHLWIEAILEHLDEQAKIREEYPDVEKN